MTAIVHRAKCESQVMALIQARARIAFALGGMLLIVRPGVSASEQLELLLESEIKSAPADNLNLIIAPCHPAVFPIMVWAAFVSLPKIRPTPRDVLGWQDMAIRYQMCLTLHVGIRFDERHGLVEQDGVGFTLFPLSMEQTN